MLPERYCCKICLLQRFNLRTSQEIQDFNLSALKKQPMFCHETNNAVSESAWACTWLNVHVPKRLPFARSTCSSQTLGLFKQPPANRYFMSYCCFTTAKLFHLNWSLLVCGPRIFTFVATTSWPRDEKK